MTALQLTAQRTNDKRPRRVVMLLLIIVLLSAADLILTLTHLQSTGMLEANPIAVWLIKATGSSWLLGAFKATTVGISVSLLFIARRHVQGEIAAWCGVAVLIGVSLMWAGYTMEFNDVNRLMMAQRGLAHEWMVLD